MKLLIVGNGSIGVHDKSHYYINNHTGYFLKRLGKTCSVTFAENSTKYDLNNNLQNFDLNEHNINYVILPKKRKLSFFLKVILLIKKHDVIYLFYPGSTSKFFALLAILMNKPFGLYIRGQYYNKNNFDNYILTKAKFILAVSPTIVHDVSKNCLKVEVIKPMISIQIKDFMLDRDYSLPEIWNLLFVGRVEERKGIYELLDIAKNLKTEGLSFTLNIVGGGDLFSNISEKINTLNLQDEIILHGLISSKVELKKLYDNANVFVFTSHDEGFPRVLYEAMASALPIFTTFVGGIPGRMENLNNCIEIPVKNSFESSRIISENLRNNKLLEEIGSNGQETLRKVIDGSLLSHEDLLLKCVDELKVN